MKFGLEPISNVPVYRRIGINDPTPAEQPVVLSTWEICDRLMKQSEANRIWGLVKGAAEGTNVSSGSEVGG